MSYLNKTAQDSACIWQLLLWDISPQVLFTSSESMTEISAAGSTRSSKFPWRCVSAQALFIHSGLTQEFSRVGYPLKDTFSSRAKSGFVP